MPEEIRSASAHPGLRFAKPESSRTIKAREKRDEERRRRECLAIVRKRDNWTCRRCQTRDGLMHGHEIIARSLGGDDTDPSNVILLCERCHLYLVHYTKTVRIEGADANYPVKFVYVDRSDVGRKLHRSGA